MRLIPFVLSLLIATAAMAQDRIEIAGPIEPRATTRAEVRDRVFLIAQTAQSSRAGKALAQAAGRIAAGSADLADLLRRRQDAADRVDRLNQRVAQMAGQQGAEAERQIAAVEADLAAQRARIAESDARLNQDFPDFQDLVSPAPLSRPELQALLDDDEALLMTLTDEDYTYVWAISRNGADWHRAEIGTATLTDRVKLLRGQLIAAADTRAGLSLKDRTAVRDLPAFDRQVANRIYADLFAPLEHVFGSAAHVMAAVDGPLTSLPLSILVARAPPPGNGAASFRATAWLARRHALTTLPTVSALRTLRRLRDAPRTDREGRLPFIGFGDPLLGYRLAGATGTPGDGHVVSRGIYEDITRVADLAPLPNTARELRTLAATMGAGPGSVFLAADATEAQVKATDLSHADIVAFATHGLLADGLPGLSEPALVFTPPTAPSAEDDALLTASEAAQLKLSAQLVILSACDTAGSDGTPGAEGLSGLARAFLYAGARAILVSHWPVDDFAARVLTTGMLDRMTADTPRRRAEALQAAMLDLMSDTSEDRFAHPRIWAPFVVVGEGGFDG